MKNHSIIFKSILVIVLLFLVLIIFGVAQRAGLRQGAEEPFWRRISHWVQNKSDSSENLNQVQTIGEVPPEYLPLYQRLQDRLDAFNARLDRLWSGSKPPVVFSASLITANPNSGDALLSPQVYDLNTKYLSSLENLGIKGVGIDINFPLLDPNFRGAEKSQEYLDFYKKLINEIKNRGLKVEIEVQPIFPDFSDLPVKQYYRGLTLETYNQRLAEMLKTIATELQPDYLTVANEPSTAAGNTGLPLENIDVSIDEVGYLLSELKELGLNNIKYGAGFGNWQQDYQTWAQRYSELPNLDFLNIHIYPADGNLLDRVLTIADTAQKNGKRLAIHETWLYKWQIGEQTGQIAASANIFARDAYSFWQPLDEKFLEALVKLAYAKNFEYVSPFWSNFFFSYFDYNEVKGIAGRTIMKESILSGAQASQAGKITQTGQYYKELISD